jgi:hypothetical protein
MRIRYAEKDPIEGFSVADFWRNFVTDAQRYSVQPDPLWRIINSRLAEYDAVINREHIEFANSEDAILFLLRWS